MKERKTAGNPLLALEIMSRVMSYPEILVSSIPYKEPFETDLGEGLKLVPIDPEDKMKKSHLYKDGVQVSDMVFRKGGLGGKFKDGYCDLIHIKGIKNSKYGEYEETEWVIIDTNGKVVFNCGSFDTGYLLGGIVLSYKHKYYNLQTGAVIMEHGYHTCTSKESLFVEHYDRYDRIVSQIILKTGEVIIHN